MSKKQEQNFQNSYFNVLKFSVANIQIKKETSKYFYLEVYIFGNFLYLLPIFSFYPYE